MYFVHLQDLVSVQILQYPCIFYSSLVDKSSACCFFFGASHHANSFYRLGRLVFCVDCSCCDSFFTHFLVLLLIFLFVVNWNVYEFKQYRNISHKRISTIQCVVQLYKVFAL